MRDFDRAVAQYLKLKEKVELGESKTRRFELHRQTDVSGISGTGIVADGVVWEDGSATIRWRGDRPSIVHWQDIAHAESVHGHGGFTEFVFLDV